MAATLTHNLRVAIDWVFRDALDLGNVSDTSKLEYSASVANGNLADQCDLIWHDQRDVGAGANDDLDLTALVQTIFGASVTKNFAKVKTIVAVCISTATGEKLNFDSSVTNGFTGPFAGSATSKVEIGADSPTVLSSKKDGWATGGSNKVLRIHNPGAGPVTYRIAIVGTKP